MAGSVVESIWLSNGFPSATLSRLVLSQKPDPNVDSSFKLGSAAQAAISLSALSAAHFHSLRTGVEQDITVDARHAVLEFQSEMWYTVDGKLNGSGSVWDDLAGTYKTKDGSYVRIHTNFPHHRQGILSILDCPATKSCVAEALLEWNAVDFETKAASHGMCATALRSFEEWDIHPQGIAMKNTPPVELIKIGEAPNRPLGCDWERPLEGVRVLDLSRVLAGPVCGRALAAHGADVLLITSPNLPDLPQLDIETSRGKRTTQLDLNQPFGRVSLASLAKDADVFLQAYRPGGLDVKGFGPEQLANVRPGIVYASLNAYGWEGPWKGRRGFDSLVQTATGFNVAESRAYASYTKAGILPPRPLPIQALDHAAGYFLAFGINAALCKTITEGGSWEVRVSLAAVGQWIRSLGSLSSEVGFGEGKPLPTRALPQDPEISALAIEVQQSQGDSVGRDKERKTMTAISHSAILDKTPVREGEAPMGLNVHKAQWLPRR